MRKDDISFCNRCSHAWKVRKKTGSPKRCPKCKTHYWNSPRKKISRDFVLEMKNAVINLHDAIIEISGGEKGVRDDGGIYYSIYSILNYREGHAGDPAKLGAFILDEFARKHHFNDGNKRTAYSFCKVMMFANRCHLSLEYERAVDFVVRVAEYQSKVKSGEIVRWLRRNCKIVKTTDVETYLNQVLVDLIVEESHGKN